MRGAKQRQGRVDPDPFTAVIGIGAILAGLAQAIDLFRSAARNQPVKQRRKLLKSLGEARDLLEYLDADIKILTDLLSKADPSGNRPFRLGSRAFLAPADFKRYAQVTENAYDRLRKLLRCTHNIEKVLQGITPLQDFENVAHLDDVQGMVKRLLTDEGQSIDEAMQQLQSVVRATREMVRNLEETVGAAS